MRKVLTFTLIFAGTVFVVFLFNIMMYATVPEYHDAISAAVASSKDDIPVVTPEMVKEPSAAIQATDETTSFIDVEDEKVALSYEAEAEETKADPEVIIVDKQYHEDCGTGKGYWVITYSDGSTAIE
jgi:hypothetical protein